MPKVLLTDLSIRKLPVTNGSKTWWDTALPAFGIRVGKRARTFTVMTGSDRSLPYLFASWTSPHADAARAAPSR